MGKSSAGHLFVITDFDFFGRRGGEGEEGGGTVTYVTTFRTIRLGCSEMRS